MKIAYVVQAHLNPGGTDRILASKSSYLARHGYEVYIISSQSATEIPFFEYNQSIKFFTINEKNKKVYIEKVEALLKQLKPDIAISMGIGNAKYLCRVKDPSLKILEWHYGKYKKRYWLANFDSSFLGRLLVDCYTDKRSRLAKKYDKLVLLTQEDKKSWYGVRKPVVIPNLIPSLPTEEVKDYAKKRVVAAGWHIPQKGFDNLVKIWAKIAKKHPDWELCIFGDAKGRGKDKAKLEKLIKELGVKDSIRLEPATQRLNEEYAQSSIFAFSSRYEGFGLVLLEAMAVGLPAVSFACKCGPYDILNDGKDGYLVEQGDLDGFAQKLSTLMENEELRQKMGQAARQRALDFTEEKVMPIWTQLFEELVKNK